jgi:hypothetical protein
MTQEQSNPPRHRTHELFVRDDLSALASKHHPWTHHPYSKLESV